MRASKWKIRRTGWRGNWIDNPHDKWSNSAELLHFFRCVRRRLTCFSVPSGRCADAIRWLMLAKGVRFANIPSSFGFAFPAYPPLLWPSFVGNPIHMKVQLRRKRARYCAHCKLKIGEIHIQLPLVAYQRTLRWLAFCHLYKIKEACYIVSVEDFVARFSLYS